MFKKRYITLSENIAPYANIGCSAVYCFLSGSYSIGIKFKGKWHGSLPSHPYRLITNHVFNVRFLSVTSLYETKVMILVRKVLHIMWTVYKRTWLLKLGLPNPSNTLRFAFIIFNISIIYRVSRINRPLLVNWELQEIQVILHGGRSLFVCVWRRKLNYHFSHHHQPIWPSTLLTGYDVLWIFFIALTVLTLHCVSLIPHCFSSVLVLAKPDKRLRVIPQRTDSEPSADDC